MTKPKQPKCTCVADPNDPFAFSFAEERQRGAQCPVHKSDPRRRFVYEKGDVVITPPVGGIVLDDSGEVHKDDPAEREIMERGAAIEEKDSDDD